MLSGFVMANWEEIKGLCFNGSEILRRDRQDTILLSSFETTMPKLSDQMIRLALLQDILSLQRPSRTTFHATGILRYYPF